MMRILETVDILMTCSYTSLDGHFAIEDFWKIENGRFSHGTMGPSKTTQRLDVVQNLVQHAFIHHRCTGPRVGLNLAESISSCTS